MKKILFITTLLITSSIAWAQGVLDALPAITSQARGTARSTAMGGAFGALGGDPSSIIQNPAGIGVYRSSEISVTADFNIYNNTVVSSDRVNKNNEFTFTSDNIGIVGSIHFRTGILRNLNFGFSYNNLAQFNNHYRADWSSMQNSLTNMIADEANYYNLTPYDLAIDKNYNPYNTNLPWMSVLAYNTNLIHTPNNSSQQFSGLFEYGTTRGSSSLVQYTAGGIDEYDFNISGNLNDKFYWGVTVNLTSINYRMESYYSEYFDNAMVKDNFDRNSRVSRTDGDYELYNALRTDGFGAGIKVGIIYRPVNFLRIGLAFHSPTYYAMTDKYNAAVGYRFSNVDGHVLSGSMDNIDNQTDFGSFDYSLTTPCHYLASLAAVIGKHAILSFDYEYIHNRGMYYSSPYTDYTSSNNAINTQMDDIHNVRAGLEIRITPFFSIRGGYNFESSPMQEQYFNGSEAPLLVEGTIAHYQIPDNRHSFSGGLGFRFNNVSIDAAYVHQKQDINIFPFIQSGNMAKMDMRYNSVKLTLGYRF